MTQRQWDESLQAVSHLLVFVACYCGPLFKQFLTRLFSLLLFFSHHKTPCPGLSCPRLCSNSAPLCYVPAQVPASLSERAAAPEGCPPVAAGHPVGTARP